MIGLVVLATVTSESEVILPDYRVVKFESISTQPSIGTDVYLHYWEGTWHLLAR